jgi:hypothetical protein
LVQRCRRVEALKEWVKQVKNLRIFKVIPEGVDFNTDTNTSTEAFH